MQTAEFVTIICLYTDDDPVYSGHTIVSVVERLSESVSNSPMIAMSRTNVKNAKQPEDTQRRLLSTGFSHLNLEASRPVNKGVTSGPLQSPAQLQLRPDNT